MAKKATEIYDQIMSIERQIYSLSDDLSKEIEWGGIDPVYLKGKFQGVVNVTNHIKDQIKHVR